MKKMKNIQLSDLNGHEVSLNEYAGKNVLIFMWASW
jgi:glutathione peroxidase-family protein